MKLSSILLRAFKVPGNRFRGKVRMIKIVTPLTLNDMKNDFRLEEQNMLYLRNPYLTLEQSKGLTKELKKHQIKSFITDANARDEKYSSKSTRLIDQLKQLKFTDDWDVIK